MTDYWSVVFPLLAGVADPRRAQPALDAIERGWISQWGGVHTSGSVPQRCVFRAVVEPGTALLLNGAEVAVTPNPSAALGRDEVAVEFTLEPLADAQVSVVHVGVDRP